LTRSSRALTRDVLPVPDAAETTNKRPDMIFFLI